jgi:hypothetical protein
MGLLSLSDLNLNLDPPELRYWSNALASGDPRRVVGTYAPEALLLATLDPTPKAGRETILGYFRELLRDKPGLTVVFDRHWRPRPGVLAGTYEFRWPGGSLPARFTFVVGPRGIQHHHSSALP